MFPRMCASMAILCVGLGALSMFSVTKAQPNYLVPLPQKGSVIALNNSGQVLYDTGLLTGNAFAPFPTGFTAPAGSPRILGESGVVAGTTTTGHLATYSAGTVTDLGLPPWQIDRLAPSAINASGQIVGVTWPIPIPTITFLQPSSSFFYSGGVFNGIKTNNLDPTDSIIATDLNDSGQVVAFSWHVNCGPPCVAGFLVTDAVPTDLGTQQPFAINASGHITGFASNDSWRTSHSYIWANGTLTLLAEPPPFTASGGEAINKGGQVVGLMSSAQSSVPFFYNGVMTDINSLVSASDPLKSSVTIGGVLGINDDRLLLVVSTVPVVGASTAYLLQAPWLDVTPGPLTFANQGVGTTSEPQMLTLTNSGTVPLYLDSISFAPGAVGFSQTNACPKSLAAGANCTVSVTFAPSAAGVQNVVLNVVTGGATITVPLTGTAPVTISLSATPTSPTVGQPFTITWTASPGSSCQSSGGAANDGWSATIASGSASVTETNPGAYTYDMTCTAGSESTAQSLNVTVANPPSSGGGGAVDLGSLLLLVASLVRCCRIGSIRTLESTCTAPATLGVWAIGVLIHQNQQGVNLVSGASSKQTQPLLPTPAGESSRLTIRHSIAMNAMFSRGSDLTRSPIKSVPCKGTETAGQVGPEELISRQRKALGQI